MQLTSSTFKKKEKISKFRVKIRSIQIEDL